MPELVFKGKEYVYNHHLTVPYRPLVPHADKSVGPPDLGGNLIIHGDNLHALKSLLPRYAGKVDLVFIDPPYNTGNENWSYNDNVNSPIMREWLRSNPVNAEDMLRHDKWLCMMWPRLALLRELLSERGSVWMTLDDNEVHRAKLIQEELFGSDNFVSEFVWQKMDSPSRNDPERVVSPYHDYVLCFAKDSQALSLRPETRESIIDAYPLTLTNGQKARRRQLRKNGKNARREDRPTLWYRLEAPDGTEVWPIAPEGWEGRWVLRKEEWMKREREGLTEWIRRESGWVPYYLERAPSEGKAPWSTIWFDIEQNRQAKATLTRILGIDVDFQTPKPVSLIRRILDMHEDDDLVVLDSFAGSGTTAHAVLEANAKDGGKRRFILVECEDYADRITAERVRRVIKGYAYSGTQREELLREKVTWTQLQKADRLLAKVESIKKKEGFDETPDLASKGQESRRFDRIAVKVEDCELRVEGEKKISERVEGLGGEFTFCSLGETIDPEKILSGENLPDYESLGAWLFHTATGGTLDAKRMKPASFYLGEAENRHLWLIYKPDLAFLKSPEAALTLSFAKSLREQKHDKKHLVFAAAKFLSNRQLLELGVEFAPLPFSLYREA